MKLRSKSMPVVSICENHPKTRSRSNPCTQSGIKQSIITKAKQPIRKRKPLKLSKSDIFSVSNNENYPEKIMCLEQQPVDIVKEKTTKIKQNENVIEKGLAIASVFVSNDDNQSEKTLNSEQTVPNYVAELVSLNVDIANEKSEINQNERAIKKAPALDWATFSVHRLNRSKKSLSSDNAKKNALESNVFCKGVAELASTSGTTNERSRPLRSRNVQATKTLLVDRQCNQKTENRLVCRIDLKRSDNYNVGDIVLVKWSSYPYWPARITDIRDKNVNVIFFGDNSRTAKVKKDLIYDFQANVDYIVKTLNSRQWKSIYMKTIREVEIYVGIPFEASLINKVDH